MAWIETVPDDAAEGKLEKIYDAARSRGGFVAEILRVSSLNVPALEGYLARQLGGREDGARPGSWLEAGDLQAHPVFELGRRAAAAREKPRGRRSPR